MNRLESMLRQAAEDLNRHGHPWALVGGFAISARATPRFTRDIDIAVAVADDAGAEELVRRLLGEGYTFFASVEHDNGRLATVRLKHTADGVDVLVDVLFASSGIEPEIAEAAEFLEVVPDLILPVATTGHLVALKLLARDDQSRPQDLADLRALLETATPEDLDIARKAVSLITNRGYNRDRDLLMSLDDLLTDL
ncbi:nucleotidyl transferase AbiEii/AbiGii toxin family protein [Nonomuraea sp. NBC_00507]|uniref:nucleotidyl transferase AbiEii/AbiGii toxin family protein n=1 Tax=Nonomuraea sp. NBC_00507 TaxID=2976002 RepID=UPI002E1933A6